MLKAKGSAGASVRPAVYVNSSSRCSFKSNLKPPSPERHLASPMPSLPFSLTGLGRGVVTNPPKIEEPQLNANDNDHATHLVVLIHGSVRLHQIIPALP